MTVHDHDHDHERDRVNAAYDGVGVDEATKHLTRQRVHWIVDRIPPGRTLDIGCSEGIVSLLLAKRGDEAVGVDVVEDAVAVAESARAELPADIRSRVRFELGDAEKLPFDAGVFDNAVLGEVLEHVADPVAVILEAHRVLKEEGTLVVTVPFGVMPHHDHHRVFYHGTLHRLLGPLFELPELTVLERHLAAVATRKPGPSGAPEFRLTTEEMAFWRREDQYLERIAALQDKLDAANVKYRTISTTLQQTQSDLAALKADTAKGLEERRRLQEQVATLRAEVETREGEVAELRRALESEKRSAVAMKREIGAKTAELASARTKVSGAYARLERAERNLDRSEAARQRAEARAARLGRRLDTIESSRAWRIVSSYWRLMDRLRPGKKRDKPGPADKEATPPTPAQPRAAALQPADVADRPEATRSESTDDENSADQRSTLAAAFERWCEVAKNAPGPEVVFMFSGTTYVQGKRANRPIRLTKVYLGEGSPVFFNYYRWRNDESLPDHPEPLLFQSPIDITPDLIDELLNADFGKKRKVMFASFPHELMVRNLTKAQQRGWTVIYDARDDWEEFSKVGMAKWYRREYEWYITREADVVTAVSLPLAHKLAALADRSDIGVNANALDPAFPRPRGPRQPTSPPTVGYFGHLTDKWFDWDLLLKTAKAHPDWTFELAGHQAPEQEFPDNVHLLGLLSHDEIAELSTHWSAALIPFKTGLLADGVDPIKVYEYLHLGLPVLSTFFPQMRDYPGVRLAESSAEFVSALQEVVNSEIDQASVDAWLAVNTWTNRVAEYRRLAASVAEHPAPIPSILRGST